MRVAIALCSWGRHIFFWGETPLSWRRQQIKTPVRIKVAVKKKGTCFFSSAAPSWAEESVGSGWTFESLRVGTCSESTRSWPCWFRYHAGYGRRAAAPRHPPLCLRSARRGCGTCEPATWVQALRLRFRWRDFACDKHVPGSIAQARPAETCLQKECCLLCVSSWGYVTLSVPVKYMLCWQGKDGGHALFPHGYCPPSIGKQRNRHMPPGFYSGKVVAGKPEGFGCGHWYAAPYVFLCSTYPIRIRPVPGRKKICGGCLYARMCSL